MIVKTDRFELEISSSGEIYLGSINTGQTFRKWNELDDRVKNGLENIIKQIEGIVDYSEKLLATPETV